MVFVDPKSKFVVFVNEALVFFTDFSDMAYALQFSLEIGAKYHL